MRIVLLVMILGAVVYVAATSSSKKPVSYEIAPDVVLEGAGSNIDTIAFWTGTTPEETLMFVTSKADSLVEVWRFPFGEASEGTPLRHESFGTGQVNGVVVDQGRDRLYVSVGEPAGVVVVFTLPDTEFERVLLRAPLGKEPGIALYHWPDGRTWLYTTGDRDRLLYVRDAATGEEIVTSRLDHDLETVWGDEYHGVVYVPDENGRTGVYAFTPEMGEYKKGGRSVFGAGVFQSDEEGILIYRCQTGGEDNGSGFIVVTDQRMPASEFEFFDRDSWRYLGSLHITGVGNTDGIASLQRSLPGYPLGIFAAINDDTHTALVGWDRIFAATGLACREKPAALSKGGVTQPAGEG